MGFNVTNSIKISSDGIWQGENTLHYAFPLLIIQTTLVVFLSRLLAFLLKPLHQPKVVAEILVSFIHCQYIFISFYFKECYVLWSHIIIFFCVIKHFHNRPLSYGCEAWIYMC